MLRALLAAACLAASPAPAEEPEAKEIYAEVQSLRAAGKRYAATRILWPAAERFPRSVPIQAAYADEAVAAGHYEDTLALYKGRYDEKPTPENAYLFARIDYDRVRARGVVHRALRAGADLEGLRWLRTLFRAEDLAATGRHEAALASIDVSPDGQTLDAMAVVKARISLLMGMGRLDEADRAAEVADKETDWGDPGLHSLRLGVRFLRGDLEGVRAQSGLTPGATAYAYALSAEAAYLSRTGKITQARELWRRILDSPRDFYGWDEARMEALSLLGNGNAAAVQAAALLALDPGSDAARVQIAAYERQFGRTENAEKLAREALAKNPRSLAALGLVGSMEFEHGRYRDALALYDRALALAPGVVEFHVGRAAVLSHMGDRDGQRAGMRRAARLNDKHPYFLHEYGRMKMDAGEYEEGLVAYTDLLAQEEPGLDEYRGFGRCSVGSNRVEQGLAAFEAAREFADTADRKKAVDDDVAWANGILAEASSRYARDANAVVVKLAVKAYLDDAPPAVYRDGLRLTVGRPWGAVLARWRTEGASARRTLWAPSGAGVYALVDNRVDYLELKTGSTRTIVADVPSGTALSDALPVSRYFSGFALSPNGKHLYVLARETKRGKAGDMTLLDYTAQDKAPREIFRRREIAFMQADPVSGRLLLAGGGNLRLDLAAGTTIEFPIVGCRTEDMDYSPGGERLACSALDGKGPEARELVLYDIGAARKVPLEVAGLGAAWSPDGQFLAYVWRGRQLRVLELKTGKVTAYDVGHRRHYLLPHPVYGGMNTRWSADGRFIHCTLEASKDKPGRNWYGELGEPTTLIVDRRDKVAWTRTGAYHEFEWAPAAKP